MKKLLFIFLLTLTFLSAVSAIEYNLSTYEVTARVVKGYVANESLTFHNPNPYPVTIKTHDLQIVKGVNDDFVTIKGLLENLEFQLEPQESKTFTYSIHYDNDGILGAELPVEYIGNNESKTIFVVYAAKVDFTPTWYYFITAILIAALLFVIVGIVYSIRKTRLEKRLAKEINKEINL